VLNKLHFVLENVPLCFSFIFVKIHGKFIPTGPEFDPFLSDFDPILCVQNCKMNIKNNFYEIITFTVITGLKMIIFRWNGCTWKTIKIMINLNLQIQNISAVKYYRHESEIGMKRKIRSGSDRLGELESRARVKSGLKWDKLWIWCGVKLAFIFLGKFSISNGINITAIISAGTTNPLPWGQKQNSIG